jgi:hypothetical protein
MQPPPTLATLESCHEDVLFSIACRHLPTLLSLASCSTAMRDVLLSQFYTQRSLTLSREEVTIGTAELMARTPLEWVELEADDRHPTLRICIADLARGLLPNDDPLVALLAAPVLRRHCISRVVFHDWSARGQPSCELDVARSLAEGRLSLAHKPHALPGLRLSQLCHDEYPPSVRESCYIVLAGLMRRPSAVQVTQAAALSGNRSDYAHPDSSPEILCASRRIHVCVAGVGRLCGVALAAAEWRLGGELFDPTCAHPTLCASTDVLGALDDCRRRHAVGRYSLANSPRLPLSLLKRQCQCALTGLAKRFVHQRPCPPPSEAAPWLIGAAV